MNAEVPFLDGLEYQPWFSEAIGRLRLQKGSRVLMLTSATPDLCAFVLSVVGSRGHVTVLEPEAERAARVDELKHAGLTVITYRPEGTETFGQHDALVACPAIDRGWPMNLWGEVARRNLRPGGRFVIDLPGVRHCEAIESAWGTIGGPEEAMTTWNGPSESSLARLLRADGLRAIEPEVAAHMARFASPHDAAKVVCTRLGVDGRLVDGLQIVLAERVGSNQELELLFRRTRVTGMR